MMKICKMSYTDFGIIQASQSCGARSVSIGLTTAMRIATYSVSAVGEMTRQLMPMTSAHTAKEKIVATSEGGLPNGKRKACSMNVWGSSSAVIGGGRPLQLFPKWNKFREERVMANVKRCDLCGAEVEETMSFDFPLEEQWMLFFRKKSWNHYADVCFDCIAEVRRLRQKQIDAENVDIEVAEQTEPKTCEACEYWNDTEDGCADRHGCKTEPKMECVEALTLLWINNVVTDEEFYRIDARLKQTDTHEEAIKAIAMLMQARDTPTDRAL